MTLYTCGQKLSGASLGHPCGRAGDALRKAGHKFEIEVVGGYRLLPWTRSGQRTTVRQLSGQENVPILVLDDGEVVSGSSSIVRWAKANPA
ncbi:MAG: glutathione S-transferase N-terminal domain-containing protein [Actinomycetes bacterium]